MKSFFPPENLHPGILQWIRLLQQVFCSNVKLLDKIKRMSFSQNLILEYLCFSPDSGIPLEERWHQQGMFFSSSNLPMLLFLLFSDKDTIKFKTILYGHWPLVNPGKEVPPSMSAATSCPWEASMPAVKYHHCHHHHCQHNHHHHRQHNRHRNNHHHHHHHDSRKLINV